MISWVSWFKIRNHAHTVASVFIICHGLSLPLSTNDGPECVYICRHQRGFPSTSDPQLITVTGYALIVLAFFLVCDGRSTALLPVSLPRVAPFSPTGATPQVNPECVCICRHQWGALFTSDPQLITVIGYALTVLAFFVIFDGLSVALGGVVRGTGKQALAAPCTVASYYLLGLPAGAVLAFRLKLGEASS